MNKIKRISRENMKNLKGGGPSQPSEGTGCSYKCCSDKNPQLCSKTITVSVEQSGSVSCSSGSHVVPV